MILLLIAAAALQDSGQPPSTSLARAIAAGTAPDCLTEPAARGCRAPGADRYRLNDADENAPDAKARAYANDGGECGLVGAKLCTSDGIPMVRRSLIQGND